MSVSFLIFLTVCILSFIPVFRDHGKTWKEFGAAQNRKNQWAKALELFVLWVIPVLSAIGTVVTGFESATATREAKTQADQFVAQSNKLALARSNLAELEAQIRPKSLEERLRTFLDVLDKRIISELTNRNVRWTRHLNPLTYGEVRDDVAE